MKKNALIKIYTENIDKSKRRCGIAFILLFFSHTVIADDSSLYCPASSHQLKQEKLDVVLSAEQIKLRKDGKSVLDGNVQIEQGNNRMRADHMTYDNRRQRIKAEGDVRYTNCDPKSPLWFLSAEEISYDTDKKRGLVKNAWLHFSNVPVFYVPRYRFLASDDKRKSGFLLPEIGNSSDSGRQFSLPFYFNLAPNKDATLIPRYYSKRGLQLNLESRYLYSLEQGNLKFAWINDNRFDDSRYSYEFDHKVSAGDSFSMDINLKHVSDDFYLEDLGQGIDVYGGSYLRSHITSDLFWKGWNIHFSNERLTRSDHSSPYYLQPYQARPRFSVGKNFAIGDTGLSLGFFSETAQFVNKYTRVADPLGELLTFENGIRAHNAVDLRWSYRRPGFHFTPVASLSHTHYKLYNPDTSTRRTVPSFSLRTGLVFEKSSQSSRYRHTLEPELFYLNVPRRNQDSLPLFDTSESEFRFAQLFDVNRFNGIDRIGDADKISLGLSSRILHKRTGIEALRISVGKSYHLRDPSVQIVADSEIDERSNIVTEVSANLNNKVRFLSSLIWNTRYNQTVKNAMSLEFNGANKRSVNLFYRQRYRDFEQVGMGLSLIHI